jgi:L-alanine-DL-glutamate epimerase-like enolase superfamily enzyme
MKITDVTVTLFTWDGIPATQYGRHSGRFSGTSDLGLVAIRTDAGIDGHAFLGTSSVPGSKDADVVTKVLKPMLVGEDPLDRERHFQRMWQRCRMRNLLRPLGAVDVALWDLAGKIAGMPVHKLMGSFRTSAPAYASSAVLGAAEAYAEEAESFKARGWGAYKIHPPTEWQTDIKVCEAVRKAVGDDYRLMLDSTWAYEYVEDPLCEDDLNGYVKLKQRLSIPILATEYAPGGHTAYVPWLQARATDYLRGDVAVKGGLTACLKSAHLAECFHMNYEVHHGGNSLNNVANLHLIMAIRNCEYFEVLLPDGAQKYGLVEDIEVDAKGLVHAPTKPGLGAEIDFDLIRRKQLAVLS